MADFPHAVLAVDEIVIGRDYTATITIDPAPGKTNAEVVTELTGSTITARILDSDGTTVITSTITGAVSAAARTITLTITDTVTTALAAGSHYLWDVKVTTTGALIWPVRMPRRCVIRAV